MIFYQTGASSSLTTNFINIATNSGNTKACITETKSHCAYNIMGQIIGRFIHNNHLNADQTPITNIVNNIPPETIFQYNLADKDITLANTPIISNNHTNNDIHISNSLTKNHNGQKNIFGIFHLGISIIHLPNNGTYSKNIFIDPRCLNCINSINKTATVASHILNSKLVVGIVIIEDNRSTSTNIILIQSKIQLERFDNNIMKNNVTT